MATTAKSLMNSAFFASQKWLPPILPKGQKATVRNLAKNTAQYLQDSYKNADSEASFRKTIEKIQNALQKTDPPADPNAAPAASVKATANYTVATNTDPDSPLAKTMAQAKQLAGQLNLGDSAWGLESLAHDLAALGLDFSDFNRTAEELGQLVRERSLDRIAQLDAKYSGGQGDYDAERRAITGASARLANGIQKAGGLLGGGVPLNGAAAAWSSTSASFGVASSTGSASPPASNVGVKVDGVRYNASAIIAVANVIVDPLVFDLNGDGFDFRSAEDGVDFDLAGDGDKRRTAFIQGDDALLFIDSDQSGVVQDGRQLFGNADGVANGFEKLRQYDENGDGVIDEQDAAFDQLRLWAEANGNGVCEAEETMSLREAGITSINLHYDNTREEDGKGNLIGQKSSFTRTDGSQGAAVDVWWRGE